MKSFRNRLIRNFVGTIFGVLLIVYVLFNVWTNNFISEEAYRELTRSVTEVEHIIDSEASTHIYFDFSVPGSVIVVEDFWTEWDRIRSIQRLMMNTDGIIIDENNEILSPDLSLLGDYVSAEIRFLSAYYAANRETFAQQEMVRVTDTDNAYYVMAVALSVTDDISFSFLMYTDITSATLFMWNINRTLGALLLISGIISTLLSILMAAKVQKAILRLCNYAGVIGHGKFDGDAGTFEYKEFNDLAQSMDNMSDMLDTYEQSQKQFFQNVSHELRTPLMSIQGYAEGILTDVLDKNEASEVILSESERMEGLVSQILYVSRMDSGMDLLDLSGFGIKNFLYDCAGRVQVLAEKHKIAITFAFPEADAEVKTDEAKLQRAIDNILTNCIRYADATITLGYSMRADGIELSITDDGAGIAQADLPHLFERFYKGADGNSGLGLAISKDVIEKLGGYIRAENVLDGRGARFVIRIPVGL